MVTRVGKADVGFLLPTIYRRFKRQLAGRDRNAAKALAAPPSPRDVVTPDNPGVIEVTK